TTEADLKAIQKAMEAPAMSALAAQQSASIAAPATKVARPLSLSLAPPSPKAVTSLSPESVDEAQLPDFWWKLLAGERDSNPRRAFGPYTLSRAACASRAVYAQL